MPNPSQEPPAPNEDLNDLDVLCAFKMEIEIQNSNNDSIKNQWPYLNQDQDAKPQT